MRVSDCMGALVEINQRVRGTVDGPGTLRHGGNGYRAERRLRAREAYRDITPTAEARDLSARLLAARAPHKAPAWMTGEDEEGFAERQDRARAAADMVP